MVLVTGILVPGRAAAQAVVGGEVTFRNDYIWRGLTLTNRSVFQPSAFAGVQLGPGYLTGGAWWGLEPFEARDDQLSDVGRGAGRLAQVDYWVEYARRFGWRHPVDVKVGWTAYTFHGDSASGGRGSEWNSSELYFGARSFDTLGRLGFFGSAWKDLGSIGGLYSELGVGIPLPIFPGGEPLGDLQFDAKAGFSWGQQAGDGPASGYYAGEGLTHFDFALAATPYLRIRDVPITFFTAFHVQVGRDDRTLRRGPSEMNRSRAFIWFELTASLWHPFGLGDER